MLVYFIALICLVFQPGMMQSAVAQVSQDRAVELLREWIALNEDLRNHIDRSQMDLEAVLEIMEYDAESLVNLVKENIRFEQYPGLMRGAQGTLETQAGNEYRKNKRNIHSRLKVPNSHSRQSFN